MLQQRSGTDVLPIGGSRTRELVPQWRGSSSLTLHSTATRLSGLQPSEKYTLLYVYYLNVAPDKALSILISKV